MTRGKKGRKRYRANGEGWNNERADGRRDVGLTIHTPDGPKRIRTTKRTRAEGDAWLAEQKRNRNLGTIDFDAGSLTFGEYLDRWLEDGVKGVLKEGSYLSHRVIVRRHLKPSLGRVKLAKLTAAHFQALYRQKLEGGLKARTVLGIPNGTRLHALRHTAATVALQEGVPAKVVSEMLGHSSIKQTLDTYSYVIPGMQEDAAKRLDSALF